MRTKKKRVAVFADWCVSNLTIAQLPREARLCFTVFVRDARGDVPRAWANVRAYREVVTAKRMENGVIGENTGGVMRVQHP